MGRFLFWGDPHLGHRNILKSRTQFSCIEEMDEYIISRYNKKVYRDDDVFIPGDFSFLAKSDTVETYLKRLKGKKHLITGNHDFYWIKKEPRLLEYFESVHIDYYRMEKRLKKKTITVCHYPMLEWMDSREDMGYCIHGHIHDLKNNTYYIIKEYLPFCLNCGVDINNYEPVLLEELIENNRIWYERPDQE